MSTGKELIEKGRDLQIKGDLPNAEIYYKQALEHEDSKLEAHNCLGANYLSKGDVMQAIHHWQEGLKLDPDNFESLCNLGYMLTQMQRIPEAISYLEKANALNPERDDVVMQLAQLRAQTNDLAGAESILLSVIKNARTDNENVHLLLAQVKAMGNDMAGSEAALKNLLTLKPNLPEALTNLGQLAEGAGDMTQAAAYYQTAIDKVPFNVPAKIEFGRFLTNLGRFDEALEQLLAANKLKPGEWAINVHLGNVYQEMGDFDNAIKTFRKAISINPQDLGTQQNLSRVLSRFVPPWHLGMLADHERNDAFEKAINKAVNEDAVVLDIGTGSGLLALMAAKAGAKKVYACEQSSYIADVAKENIKKNGYKSQIKLYAKKSSLIGNDELPEKPNIVVAEIFDAGLLGEQAMPSFRHALNELCAPGARVIPKSADIKGKLLHAPRLSTVYPTKSISGFDLTAFDQFRIPEEYVSQNLNQVSHDFCSEEFDMLSVDFSKPWETIAPNQYRWFNLEVEVNSEKPIHGVAFWFTLHLDEEIALSSDPSRLDNHWGQAAWFFNDPIQAKPGDKLQLPFCYNDFKVWFGPAQII